MEFSISGNTDESKRRTEIVLFISNTGKGLDQEFSLDIFCKKGGKIGDSAGDGYGGFMICEVIKYMNGRLDYIDERGSGYDLATTFEISFPIIQADSDENI